MALTVEDGSGIVGAESYGTVAAIRLRWDDVGYLHSGYTDTQVEAAARRATEWLEGVYRSRLPGTPLNADQGLHFPATGAVDVYGRELAGIPSAMFRAQCEATYREVVTPNSLTPDIVLADSASRAVKRRKVGPGGVEREFERVENPDDLKPMLTAVDSLLSKILKPETSGVVPVRLQAIGPLAV